MKYFITLLFVSLTFTCANAQAEIEFLSGSTDIARWTMTKAYPDGSAQTWTEPYDSIQNVVDFGRILYYEGGFIGRGRVAPNYEYYTDELLLFMKESYTPIDTFRRSVSESIAGVDPDLDPMLRDTSHAAEMVGLWHVISPACGMPNDTMEIYMVPALPALYVAPVTGPEPVQILRNLSNGVLNLFSTPFGSDVTIVRDVDGQWRGANGCTWQKIVE